MSSHRSEQEKRVAAACLVIFGTLLLGMMVLEVVMWQYLGEPNAEVDFARKASLGFVMPYFLIYLVVGGVGLVGVVGLVQVYGSSSGNKLATDVVKLSAIGYFGITYWLWSAMWIVQHRITLLAEIPTNAPEWVIQGYEVADAFRALPSWGGLGPSIVLFGGLAWLLARGARLLPRAAALVFLLLAASQLASLVYLGVRGFEAQSYFLWAIDIFFNFGRVVAFLLAAAALFTEKGIFARKTRTTVRGG
jgi:hypothetical protein